MRKGIIRTTYGAVSDRGIKYLRQAGFVIDYVVDLPETQQLDFVGSHPSMAEIQEGDVLLFYVAEFTVEEKYWTGEGYSQVQVEVFLDSWRRNP